MTRQRPCHFAFALAATLVPSTARAQAASPSNEARIGVHLDGPARAVLQRQSQVDGTWSSLCAAPCDLLLPLAATYRIDGRNVPTSNAFQLNGVPSGHVDLKVHAGNATVRSLGIATAILGSVTALVGALYVAIGNIQLYPGAPPTPQPSGQLDAGIAIIGGGAVVIILGVLAVATNETTVSAPPSPGRNRHAIASDAWKPSPAWRMPSRSLPLPPPVEVPLWTVPF